MPTGELDSANSASTVAAFVRDAILDGEYQPGQRLVEAELARALRTSRTPVREALFHLQAEGLVEIIPNRGATVRPYRLRDLEEVYGLRAVLEGHAAARAATRVTASELRELSLCIDRIERYDVASQLEASIAENLKFHGIFIAAAASPRLSEMLVSATRVPSVYRSYYWYTPELRTISQQFHRWLFKALLDHDVERAGRVAYEHVIHARDVLLEHFSAAGSGDQSVVVSHTDFRSV